MRLYVNLAEIPTLKRALKRLANSPLVDDIDHAKRLLERVELCEQLQNNERRGGETNDRT